MSRSSKKKTKSLALKLPNKLQIFFIISVCVFAGYLFYAKTISDTTPPVVTCDREVITVSVDATDKEMMKGVTAKDKRSGDVTDSLVIESISPIADGERIIVYAAVDEKGNVGRAQRVLKYSDYKEPYIKLTESLVFPKHSNVNLLNYVTAYSTLDGDLTSKIKYSIDSYVDYSTQGIYKVEFRVSDSAGTVGYLTTYLEII